MSKYLIFLITLIFISVGCKKSDTSNPSDFCAIADADAITLRNNTDEPYYYFICEQNATTLIDWAAWCSKDNEVLNNNNKKILKKDIYGYLSDSQSIVIYYWTCVDEKPVLINNLVLKNSKPYFSICKNE